MKEILEQFGRKIVNDLGKSLPKEKDASGKLRGSMKFTISVLGENTSFLLKMEDYYKWVDEGRKAGKFPPPSSILKWLGNQNVLSKISRGSTLIKGKGLSKSIGEKEKKTLAYLIGRKIKRKGIKPTYFFTDVIEDGRIQKLKASLIESIGRNVTIELLEA